MARGGKGLEGAEQHIRTFSLGYPETNEDHPWGHSAFKIRGKKAFVFMGSGDEGLSLSIKLPESHRQALQLPFTEPTHYGMGRYGWVTASFSGKHKPPLDLLEAWIDESFRAIAPKTLVKQLDAERGEG